MKTVYVPTLARPTSKLRRTQRSEPYPCLRRAPQTLWACTQKTQCTSSPLKYLAIRIHEPARQRARDLVNTPAFVDAQRKRKKVEALFAELKNQIGLPRLRLRRLKATGPAGSMQSHLRTMFVGPGATPVLCCRGILWDSDHQPSSANPALRTPFVGVWGVW
jgi:hypothetical protein